jgi:phage tail-like protein
MAVAARKNPYRTYRFLLQIDGATRAGFRECSAVEYGEDFDPVAARKLPGLWKHGNITLKRGVMGDAKLWQWRKRAIDGRVARKNGSILLIDDSGAEIVRWNFRRGVPTKWTGPSLNASANDVEIETLEIAHEGLEIV